MYRREYRRDGFRFRWVPVVLGILFLMLLFSGGFHRLWFFVWPLFFGIPFFVAGVIATLIALRWRKDWNHGAYHGPHEFFGEFFRGEKAKRSESDPDSETFYA